MESYNDKDTNYLSFLQDNRIMMQLEMNFTFSSYPHTDASSQQLYFIFCF